MKNNILIIYNSIKNNSDVIAAKIAESIKRYAENAVIDIYSDDKLSLVESHEYRFVIGVGGDGTVLKLIHRFNDIPVYCFNMGRVGFLADGNVNDIDENLKDIFGESNFCIDEHNFIEASVNNERFYAVNDILVGKIDMLRTIDLSVGIDGEKIGRFICDGAIVSSSVGSTAYNLSLGGPVVYPGCCGNILNIIASKDIRLPSIMIPEDSCIGINIEKHSHDKYEGILGIDGSYRHLMLESNTEVKIYTSNKKFMLLKTGDYSYAAKIRTKII